jgi:hypothetical protein
MKAVGKYVLLETIDIADKVDVNGFYIPTGSMTNVRLGKYKVLSVGDIAKKEYGITENSIVYADRLACINWRSNTPFIEYTNIIYAVDEENNKYIPFKNMVIVESDEKFNKMTNGVFSYTDSSVPLGTIIESNSDKFKNGEIILLPLGGDVVQFNNKTLHIYKDIDIHTKCILDDDTL